MANDVMALLVTAFAIHCILVERLVNGKYRRRKDEDDGEQGTEQE